MPLNLPDRLPAIELLKEENIFVIDNPGFCTDTAWHTTCHQVGACGSVQNQRSISKAFCQIFFCHHVPPFIRILPEAAYLVL